MLTLGSATRVCLAAGATDMRKGFEGLFALAKAFNGADPLSGHVFVFCNRTRDRIKVLYFDGSRLWVRAKRLEGGRFRWLERGQGSGTLTLLLEGIDLNETSSRPHWYQREPEALGGRRFSARGECFVSVRRSGSCEGHCKCQSLGSYEPENGS